MVQDKNGLTDCWAHSAAERKLWLDAGVNDQEIIRSIPAGNEPHITDAAGGAIEDQHDRWREMDVIEITLVVPNGQGPVGEQEDLWLDDGAGDQFFICHVPA